MKLHPPVIDGKLPAFAGTSVNIPFMLNRAVALSDLNEATPLKLKIKTVKTNREIGTFSGQYIYNKATGNYHANFILSEKKNEIKFGTFYKVQMLLFLRIILQVIILPQELSNALHILL